MLDRSTQPLLCTWATTRFKSELKGIVRARFTGWITELSDWTYDGENCVSLNVTWRID